MSDNHTARLAIAAGLFLLGTAPPGGSPGGGGGETTSSVTYYATYKPDGGTAAAVSYSGWIGAGLYRIDLTAPASLTTAGTHPAIVTQNGAASPATALLKIAGNQAVPSRGERPLPQSHPP